MRIFSPPLVVYKMVEDFFGGGPKPTLPPPPPNTPTSANASLFQTPNTQYSSLVSTGSTSGLARKANTRKRSLIGGA